MVKEIADKVNSMNLSGPDQVDVIMLALKQLNVIDQIRFLQKANKKKGCTYLTNKQQQTVWESLHQHSIVSTNTNQIAKLRVTDKSSIQAGLYILFPETHVHACAGTHK